MPMVKQCRTRRDGLNMGRQTFITRVHLFCLRSLFIFMVTGLLTSLQIDGKKKVCYAGFLEPLGLGGRQLAMGGAAIGLADDWTAMYWNPAGMAFLKNSAFGFDYQIMGVGQMSDHSLPNTYDWMTGDLNLLRGDMPKIAPSEPEEFTQTDMSTIVPSPGMAYYKNIPSIPWNSSAVTFGLGMFSLGGVGMIFDDTLTGFADTDKLQAKIDLVGVFMSFPAGVAIKLTDSLSIGATAQLVYGIFMLDIYKEYFSPHELRSYFNYSVGVGVEGDGFGLAYDVGLLWRVRHDQPRHNLSIGVIFRAPYDVVLKDGFIMDGKTTLDLKVAAIDMLPGVLKDYIHSLIPTESTMEVKWHTPMKLGIGIGYEPTPDWKFDFDAYWVQWSEWKAEMSHKDPMFNLFMDTFFKWWEHNDTIIYRAGLEYLGFDRIPLRLGYNYDPSPLKEDFDSLGTPRFPQAHGICAGAGYHEVPFTKWNRDWSIDFDLGLMFGFAAARTGANGVKVDGGWFGGEAGNWTISFTTLVHL